MGGYTYWESGDFPGNSQGTKGGNIMAEAYLGGGFNLFLFSSLLGEMIQFD